MSLLENLDNDFIQAVDYIKTGAFILDDTSDHYLLGSINQKILDNKGKKVFYFDAKNNAEINNIEIAWQINYTYI